MLTPELLLGKSEMVPFEEGLESFEDRRSTKPGRHGDVALVKTEEGPLQGVSEDHPYAAIERVAPL